MPASSFDSAQVGFAAEVDYGVQVPPTRGIAVEPGGMTLKPNFTDVASGAVKTGFRVRPARRSMRFFKDATGNLGFEPEDSGFGYWLKQMLGDVQITTLTGTSTMVATPGSLNGISSTVEKVVPFTDDSGESLFRFGGVKVPKWTLSVKDGGLLTASLDLDAKNVKTNLDTPAITRGVLAYPTAANLFYYAGGTLSVDGAELCAQGFDLAWDNKMALNKTGLCDGGLKAEPNQSAMATGTVKASVRWESMTHYEKYTKGSPGDRESVLSMVFLTPAEIAVGVVGKLQIDIPVADISGDPPTALSGDLMDSLTFEVLQEAAGVAPLTITYVTLDVAA